ncbi:MAG: amidase [Pseudomonadota bacterium]
MIFSSALAMARAIRDKKISSRELVALHLERIDEVNPKLNAVVCLAAEGALEEARAADARSAEGALHGVPITLKDSFDTEGIVSTGGTAGRKDYVPDADAVAVARLRAAGAIVLGKTNTPEMTIASECCTTNDLFGRTNNPYDLTRTTSGSSGGAAAIVAAGGAPLDLGTDTGGSIRDPAHHCGIVGVKPTSGRVPKTGHIISHGLGPLDYLTQIGPMARYVEDLAMALPLICGPDGVDPGVVDMPLGDPAKVELSELRVAMYTDNGACVPRNDVAQVVEAAGQVVAAAKAEVRPAVPEAIRDAGALGHEIRSADGHAWLRRLLERAGSDVQSSSVAWMLKDSKPVTAEAFSRILEKVEAFRSRMLQFVADYDAIICPVVPWPALPHDATVRDDFDNWSNLGAYNLTGWPGAVVRAGTSAEGLPIGVQIVGKPWREDVVLALAAHVERELGGYRRPEL